ncbi:MAG: helix-turn-helix domain-containing protein [Saprospiraceae bacterium]|nr:helix-turn-helix domain-containing protein [Saprospiraceae bacterium]
MKYIFPIISILLFCSCNSDSKLIAVLQSEVAKGDCAEVNSLVIRHESKMTESGQFYYYKGICEHRTGNYEAAIQSFEKAESLNGNPLVGIWMSVAASHSALGNEQAAMNYLKKVQKRGVKTSKYFKQEAFDPIRDSASFRDIQYSMRPSYSLWSSLFLFVALQALFLGLSLLFQKNTPPHTNRLLSSLLLAFSIVIFSWTLYWSGYHLEFPYLNNIYHVLPYLAGPILFLYVRNVIQNTKVQVRDWIHFLPLLFFSFLLAPYILSNFVQVNLNSIPYWTRVLTFNWITKILVLVGYTLAAIALLRQTKKAQDHVQTWLSYLLIAFSGYVVSMALYYVLGQFSLINPAWDYSISFALSLFIFVVGFMGYLQPRVLAGESVAKILKPTKYQKTGLTAQAEIELKEQLEEAMVMKQLYTNGGLRLGDLAEHVGATRNNVSLVINKHFGGNYFDFLNRYRVERVQKLIETPKKQHYTLIQLAYEAGFNNKVSFNKAFKKFTSMTPTAYRKMIEANNEKILKN